MSSPKTLRSVLVWSTCLYFSIKAFLIIFIAKILPLSFLRTSITLPKVPLPSCFSTWKHSRLIGPEFGGSSLEMKGSSMSSGGWVDEEGLKHWHIEPIFLPDVMEGYLGRVWRLAGFEGFGQMADLEFDWSGLVVE